MSEFDFHGKEIAVGEELLVGGRVAQLGSGKLLVQVGRTLVETEPEKCLRAAAVPQVQHFSIVAGVNNASVAQTSCSVITSSDTLPIEPGLGMPIPVPAGGMALVDVRGALRHFTAFDPGDWTLAVKGYDSSFAEIASEDIVVPMAVLGPAPNNFSAQPSLQLSQGEFFGATLTGPAASYILGRITFTFERSL